MDGAVELALCRAGRIDRVVVRDRADAGMRRYEAVRRPDNRGAMDLVADMSAAVFLTRWREKWYVAI